MLDGSGGGGKFNRSPLRQQRFCSPTAITVFVHVHRNRCHLHPRPKSCSDQSINRFAAFTSHVYCTHLGCVHEDHTRDHHEFLGVQSSDPSSFIQPNMVCQLPSKRERMQVHQYPGYHRTLLDPLNNALDPQERVIGFAKYQDRRRPCLPFRLALT